MKAAVYHGQRDIRIEEVPEPSEPAPGEAVLEVRRVALCGTDAAEWDYGPRLAHPPVVLGHEFMGVIVAVGPAVGPDASTFSVGQRVVSGAGVWCGTCAWCLRGRTNLCSSYVTHGLGIDGGLARYVRVPTRTLAPVPDALDDAAAALAQPLAVAIHAVRRSGAGPGDRVVVMGIGGIGAFIVAAAAARGVDTLIALDLDLERLETARSLGATDTIDARDRDIVAAVMARTDGLGADVILEASGAPDAPAASLAATRRGGRVVLVGLQAAPRELDLFATTVREVDILTTLAHVCTDDLPDAVDVLATTAIAGHVTERTIPLDALVADGILPIHQRTARGKIIVDPAAA